MGMGNGGYGRFITRLCCSFLLRGRTPHTLPLLQHEGPSHGRQFSTNFSNLSPSHRLQLFTNCPSMGPSHEVQSFRNRLLQRGSPTGSQALPANLRQHGLLSPWVCRWRYATPWTSMDCRGTTCLTMVVFISIKGRLSALTFQAPAPASFFFTDLGVCRVVSFTSSHSSL